MRPEDVEKYIEIYTETKDVVFQNAMRNSGRNHYVAQEISQNTFMKFYTHFHNVDQDRVLPWLLKVAKNEALNHNKKAKHEILDENVELTAELHMSDTDLEDAVWKELEMKEMDKFGGKILQSLYEYNERWYDVILLVYYLKKPQKDVAEELGISLEVLQSVLYRARKWIRKNFEAEYKTTKYL